MVVTSNLERQLKKIITMKSVAVFALALICMAGLVCGQLGIGGLGGGVAPGGGFSSILPLFFFLIFFLLFGGSSTNPSTTIVFGNFSK